MGFPLVVVLWYFANIYHEIRATSDRRASLEALLHARRNFESRLAIFDPTLHIFLTEHNNAMDLNGSTRKLMYTNTSYKYKIRMITCWLDRKATRKAINKPG